MITLNGVVSTEIQVKIISNKEMALIFYSKVEILENKVDSLSKQFERHLSSSILTWVSISDIAKQHNLTPDAIRKRLQNGDFEEGQDFKRVGGKIQVHQGAIAQLQRQRRSKNG